MTTTTGRFKKACSTSAMLTRCECQFLSELPASHWKPANSANGSESGATLGKYIAGIYAVKAKNPAALRVPNAPVQRRAAQRTVRCNRLLDAATGFSIPPVQTVPWSHSSTRSTYFGLGFRLSVIALQAQRRDSEFTRGVT